MFQLLFRCFKFKLTSVQNQNNRHRTHMLIPSESNQNSFIDFFYCSPRFCQTQKKTVTICYNSQPILINIPSPPPMTTTENPADLEMASMSSIPGTAVVANVTANDLVPGRGFLSTASLCHTASRRSSFVSGIFSGSGTQRRGSSNENNGSHPGGDRNSNVFLSDHTNSNSSVNSNNIPTMLRLGGASALPLMFCGQLRNDLLNQQQINKQFSFFTQPTNQDSMNYHLISTRSA